MQRSARTSVRVIRCASPKVKPARNGHQPVADHVAGFEPLALHEVHPGMPGMLLDDGSLEVQIQEAYERGRLVGASEVLASRNATEEAERIATQERIGALLEQIAHQTSLFLGGLEQEAFRFALAVAERIVKREVTLDESVVMRQMRDAIHRIIGVEAITIRVHPDDEALVRSHRAALLSSSDSVREIIIEGDDTVERGGCILESATGNVDARIGSQLRQIEVALFGLPLPIQESMT